MGPLPRKQGWDSVKKVQETKKLKTSENETPVEDKRMIRARQRAIGRELKRFYDDVVEEAIPDDFQALLQQIEGQTADGHKIDGHNADGHRNDGGEDSETP